MKKYQPSVKANNEIKHNLTKELQTILYRIEKGKYSNQLDKATVQEVYESLKEAVANVDSVLFTGSENIGELSEKIQVAINAFKKCLDQEYVNRLVEAADELLYYVDAIEAFGNGTIDHLDEDEEKARKASWTRKRLNRKLDELKEIKDTFVAQEKRLEKEIQNYEKDLSELDEKMLQEDNERVINELYRKITALKSKLDMLNVRRSNYSACFNILDIIYANAQEIIVASDFSVGELGKAKALLNIGRLRNVVSEPDKAIAILKAMEKEIKSISEKVKNIDEKVFGINTQQTSVTDSALQYKEELLRKKREKAQSEESLNDLQPAQTSEQKTDIKGDRF